MQQIVDDVSNPGADVPVLPSPALANNTKDKEASAAKHGKSANSLDATPENCIRFNCSSSQNIAKVDVHAWPVQYLPRFDPAYVVSVFEAHFRFTYTVES